MLKEECFADVSDAMEIDDDASSVERHHFWNSYNNDFSSVPLLVSCVIYVSQTDIILWVSISIFISFLLSSFDASIRSFRQTGSFNSNIELKTNI